MGVFVSDSSQRRCGQGGSSPCLGIRVGPRRSLLWLGRACYLCVGLLDLGRLGGRCRSGLRSRRAWRRSFGVLRRVNCHIACVSGIEMGLYSAGTYQSRTQSPRPQAPFPVRLLMPRRASWRVEGGGEFSPTAGQPYALHYDFEFTRIVWE
jgi:hypothetical protein